MLVPQVQQLRKRCDWRYTSDEESDDSFGEELDGSSVDSTLHADNLCETYPRNLNEFDKQGLDSLFEWASTTSFLDSSRAPIGLNPERLIAQSEACRAWLHGCELGIQYSEA
jgi:hypothetical protein